MKQQVPNHNSYSDEEIDMQELLETVWHGKWLIVIFTSVFAGLGLGYAIYMPDIYKSSVLVAPVEDKGNELAGLAGQFGGLASLAGINIGGNKTNQTIIAKEVLQSRAFVIGFIHRHDLAKAVFAVTGWDKDTNELRYDRSLYDPDIGDWKINEDGKSRAPSDWDLVENFKSNHLEVSESKGTGMITVGIRHYSPIVAQQWAEWLVEDINEYMRKQNIEEAEARIAYLEEKLGETNVVGMQQVFYQLIETESRTVMLASGRKEFIFKTIDPAVVPEEKSEPKRALICLIASMMGVGVGVVILFIRLWFGGAK